MHEERSEPAPSRVPSENPSHRPPSGAADARGPGDGGGQSEAGPEARDRRVVYSTVLGVMWGILPAIVGTYLLFDLGRIAGVLQIDPVLGFWGYVAVFAVSAGLGILPTYSQSILGGWVFGFGYGLAGALMGFVGGTAIGYLVARAVAGRALEQKVERHPRAHLIRTALLGGSTAKTFSIIALIRLPPNSPFALTNFALATMGAPLGLTLAATMLGMLPRTAVACFVAASGAATGAEDLQQLVDEQGWPLVLGGLAVMAVVIAIIGQIAKRTIRKMTSD
jgi:uncharacterized membrane protein YdjX (TVP38/TMEM64 family)